MSVNSYPGLWSAVHREWTVPGGHRADSQEEGPDPAEECDVCVWRRIPDVRRGQAEVSQGQVEPARTALPK